MRENYEQTIRSTSFEIHSRKKVEFLFVFLCEDDRLDDGGGEGRPQAPERGQEAARRKGLRHLGAGREPAAQAVPRDEEADEGRFPDALLSRDARPDPTPKGNRC